MWLVVLFFFILFVLQLPFVVENTCWCRNVTLMENRNRLGSLEQVNATCGQIEASGGQRTGSDVTIGPEGGGGGVVTDSSTGGTVCWKRLKIKY